MFQKQCSVGIITGTTLIGTVTARSIGYARTSGGGDTKQAAGLEVQVKALEDAGCAVVFKEIVSTRTAEKDRAQLQAALNAVVSGVKCGDCSFAHWKDAAKVINRLHDLQEQGVHIRTLDGLVNTRAMGKFAPVLIGLLTGLNEVEREVRESAGEHPAPQSNWGIGGRQKTNQAKERTVLRLRDQGCSTAHP